MRGSGSNVSCPGILDARDGKPGQVTLETAQPYQPANDLDTITSNYGTYADRQYQHWTHTNPAAVGAISPDNANEGPVADNTKFHMLINRNDSNDDIHGCGHSNYAVLNTAHFETVWPTALYDDRPLDTFLVREQNNDEDIEEIITEANIDVVAPYNPPLIPTAYRVTLNTIWPFPRRELSGRRFHYYCDVFL